MKNKRQTLLRNLIEQGLVESQQEAVRLLREHGIEGTQATVSRDLEELGAIRVRVGDGTRYSLEPNPQTPQPIASLAGLIKDFVLSGAVSGNIVVLKTLPGHASAVAAAIDRIKPEEAIGTIAGDDTVFVCCKEGVSSKVLLEKLTSRS